MENGGFKQEMEDKGMDIDPKQDPKKTRDENDDDDDEEVDVSCGIGSCRTNIFGRKFANLYVFSVILSISAVFHGMIWGVVEIHIKSLQRQFNINAGQTALIDTAAKAGIFVTALFPGHFAKRTHIPVLIGMAGLLQGIVLMIPGILQITNPYELPDVSSGGDNTTNTENNKFLCKADGENNSTHVETEMDVNKAFYYVLLAVQFTKGIIEPFHSHALMNIYMDDNTIDKTKMAHFIGIQAIIMDLAIPGSRAINGLMTKIPVDLKPTSMRPDDQRFVGAWWLGFLFFGLSTAVFSIPILLFPRRLISKKQQSEAIKKAQQDFGNRSTTNKPAGDGHNGSQNGVLDRKDGVMTEINLEKSDVTRRRSSVILPEPDPEKLVGYSLYIDDGGADGELDVSKRRLSYKAEIIYEDDVKNDDDDDDDDENNEKSDNDVKENDDPLRKQNVKQLIRDFPRAVGRLFRNVVFVFIIVDIFTSNIPNQGTQMFRGLYVTSEFNVPMEEVAFAKGVMIAVSNILGTFVSTWICSKVKSKYGYMWVIFGVYFTAMCTSPFYLLLGCDDHPVYGAAGDIGLPTNGTDNCMCEMKNQLLSCGSDGNVYYSPCVAGCLHVDGQSFSSCNYLMGSGNSTEMTLTPGLCDTPCYNNFILYVFLLGITGLVNTMAMVPRKLLMIRVVDPRDRGFAISLFTFFGILVAMPSPNLFGRIIDSACYIFDGEVCSLYNRESIRYIMSAIDIGITAIITFNFGCMILSSKIKDRVLARRKEKKERKKKEMEMSTLS